MIYNKDFIDIRTIVGTSTISERQAKKLPHPTLPIPGTKRYLVQLDVWHQLHCLNDLRKLLYPDRFPGLEELKDKDGVIDTTDSVFRHWGEFNILTPIISSFNFELTVLLDHCVDALRQTLMCHADVSPISFHVNVPVAHGVFPRLSTSHTCRDFGKIQDWAKRNAAGVWDPIITPQQAEEIIRDAGFDQSPFEDIEFLYDQFPGNPWFKYWREHPKEAEAARKKFGSGLKMSR